MEVGKMPAQRKTNQSRGLTAAGLIAVTAATLLMMAWAIFPTPALATHVDPVEFAGNPTCGTLAPGTIELKVDPVADGIYSDGTLTVTIDVRDTPDGQVFDFTSNIGLDAVFAKGSNAGNLYKYDPPGPEATADTGLHAPVNASGDFAGLSHISFCYDEDEAPNLDITKTASTTSVNEGGAFSYTITVKNTGDASATNVVVTDDLNDNLTGVSASPSKGTCDDPVGPGNTIECDLGTLAAGESATVKIDATAPQLPLPGSGVCEISIANTASVDSDETDAVSDEAPPVTVTGTGCETTTTTTPPGGGGGGGTTTTPPPAPTTTTTTPPAVAPTTIHNTSTTPAAEVLPTTVRPGKLAFTGIEDVVPIGALALTLMTTGSGLLWAGSRRRRHDGSEDED
jgi:uncharacterized repeat protein (TIGR01451 family)